jgi:16S rRNA G1207 methylase RsmC
MWSSGVFLVPAMKKWPGAEESNQTAWNLAHNTEDSFFAHLGKHDVKAECFADAMSFFQASPDTRTSLIIDNYDWNKHQTVIDLGGSHGVVELELVKQFPRLKVKVQDLSEVIATAPAAENRVEFQAYNFFTEQPVKRADVYLFRIIFHNWSDKYCVKICQWGKWRRIMSY